MDKSDLSNITRVSFSTAFYFSVSSFVLIWLSEFLYNILESTPAKIAKDVLSIIVLVIIFVMYSLSVINIILEKNRKKVFKVHHMIFSIVLFSLISIAIFFILWLMFWYEF
jgi:hypothetical protein